MAVLDHLRAAVAAKVEGEPEPQVRTAGVPSGTNLLGLLRHLTHVERFYFLGEDVRDRGATFRAGPQDTVGAALDGYRDARTDRRCHRPVNPGRGHDTVCAPTTRAMPAPRPRPRWWPARW